RNSSIAKRSRWARRSGSASPWRGPWCFNRRRFFLMSRSQRWKPRRDFGGDLKSNASISVSRRRWFTPRTILLKQWQWGLGLWLLILGYGRKISSCPRNRLGPSRLRNGGLASAPWWTRWNQGGRKLPSAFRRVLTLWSVALVWTEVIARVDSEATSRSTWKKRIFLTQNPEVGLCRTRNFLYP